jgi:ABC-2 type transport system permease protein
MNADQSMGEVMEVSPSLAPVVRRFHPLSSPYHVSKSLFANRFLVRALVQRTLRTRYRMAGLGYVWMVLEPLLLAVTYWFLFVMLAGNSDELYPIWVLVGVIVWSTFGKSLSGSVTSLSSNAQIIHTAYFPRVIFPFASTVGNITVSLGSAFVLLPLILIFNTPITVHLLWIPAGIVMAGLLGGGFGLMFASLNCRVRDIEHLFRFIVRAGFFFSPVMWTAEMALERGEMGALALWNPMATPITMVRHGIEGHAVDLPTGVALSSFAALSLFLLIGSIVFSMQEREAVKYL